MSLANVPRIWATALPSIVRVINAMDMVFRNQVRRFRDAKWETATHHPARRSSVKRLMAAGFGHRVVFGVRPSQLIVEAEDRPPSHVF